MKINSNLNKIKNLIFIVFAIIYCLLLLSDYKNYHLEKMIYYPNNWNYTYQVIDDFDRQVEFIDNSFNNSNSRSHLNCSMLEYYHDDFYYEYQKGYGSRNLFKVNKDIETVASNVVNFKLANDQLLYLQYLSNYENQIISYNGNQTLSTKYYTGNWERTYPIYVNSLNGKYYVWDDVDIYPKEENLFGEHFSVISTNGKVDERYYNIYFNEYNRPFVYNNEAYMLHYYIDNQRLNFEVNRLNLPEKKVDLVGKNSVELSFGYSNKFKTLLIGDDQLSIVYMTDQLHIISYSLINNEIKCFSIDQKIVDDNTNFNYYNNCLYITSKKKCYSYDLTLEKLEEIYATDYELTGISIIDKTYIHLEETISNPQQKNLIRVDSQTKEKSIVFELLIGGVI